MKKIHLLLPFILLLGACGSDSEKGELILTFKATYGDDPLVLNMDDYWYFDKETIRFSKLNLFISELGLAKSAGEVTQFSEIEFVDLNEANKTLAGAEAGVSFSFELASGTYKGISFGLGVSPGLNATIPTDYSSEHPLSQFSQHWDAWDSYIFSKTEGMIDSDGDDVPDLGFVYHVGSDQMYRYLEAVGDIRIPEDGEVEVVVSLDYERVFGTTQDHIDIEAFPTFHNPQDPALTELTQKLADNFAYCVSIEIR